MIENITAKLSEAVAECDEIRADAAEKDDDQMYEIYTARKFGLLDALNIIQIEVNKSGAEETFCSNCGPLDERGVHTQPDCPRYREVIDPVRYPYTYEPL